MRSIAASLDRARDFVRGGSLLLDRGGNLGADDIEPADRLGDRLDGACRRPGWASDVRGSVIQSGHVVAEEKPQDVLIAALPFLRAE